jgi:hypothetical protein
VQCAHLNLGSARGKGTVISAGWRGRYSDEYYAEGYLKERIVEWFRSGAIGDRRSGFEGLSNSSSMSGKAAIGRSCHCSFPLQSNYIQ